MIKMVTLTDIKTLKDISKELSDYRSEILVNDIRREYLFYLLKCLDAMIDKYETEIEQDKSKDMNLHIQKAFLEIKEKIALIGCPFCNNRREVI